MDRSYLTGAVGERSNALLAGMYFNLLLLRAIAGRLLVLLLGALALPDLHGQEQEHLHQRSSTRAAELLRLA
jgi:hypothetical protein